MFRYYSSHTESIRVTVVGEHTNGILKIAVARCSNKDNFSRKIGRSIAEGRLRKNILFGKYKYKEHNIGKFVYMAKLVVNHVIKYPNSVNGIKLT